MYKGQILVKLKTNSSAREVKGIWKGVSSYPAGNELVPLLIKNAA